VLVRSPRAGDLAELLTAHGATVAVQDDGGLAVTGLDAPTIADLAAGRAIPVYELTPRHPSLEQAYLDLTVVARHPQAGLFSPGVSLLVLIAWPAAMLVTAGVLFTRRDL
jgi:hypothetical protein